MRDLHEVGAVRDDLTYVFVAVRYLIEQGLGVPVVPYPLSTPLVTCRFVGFMSPSVGCPLRRKLRRT